MLWLADNGVGDETEHIDDHQDHGRSRRDQLAGEGDSAAGVLGVTLAPVANVADYGFLSDCRTAALVSRDGSIDWYCPGRFDRPSIFARLLDPSAGHWALRPTGGSRTAWSYEGDGLILRTEHTTDAGRAAVIDALAQAPETEAHELGLAAPGTLVRTVEGLAGGVAMELELVARPEYADPGSTIDLHATDSDGRSVQIRAGDLELILESDVRMSIDGSTLRASFTVRAGQTVTFRLRHPDDEGVDALADTRAAWQRWSDAHQGYDGTHRAAVRRSAAILQGLTHGPSGALVAAATTSLPERIGGTWNWDYRYAWLRDAGLTMRALWVAACPVEPQRFMDWIGRSVEPHSSRSTQIVFGIDSDDPPDERELPWLAGFRDSRPVRVGNGAWQQRQMDVPGEVLDIAHLVRERLDFQRDDVRELLASLADEAAGQWRDPDSGMWEARDQERHYLSSKVFAWVALDRAVRLELGDAKRRARWANEREEVRERALADGWRAGRGAFTGAFGSDQLDASVLIAPIVGFLGMDDPRMRATVELIERELADDGLVRRWADEPSSFLLCSYWLSQCHALAGDADRAQAVFDRATGHANDLGILSEMVDLTSGVALGNVPQAFSHAGLINAAWRISEMRPG
ncbi:glycoside hydrolase family 15 protein [soil metagenome]